MAGYCWGPSQDVSFAYAFLSGQGLAALQQPRPGGYVASRPSLGEPVWCEVDRAIAEALAACDLRLIIALVPSDAMDVARWLYVWAEPGPDVIALGHEDRSVSWCIDETTCAANEALLSVLVEDAGRELQRGELASALLSIASNLRGLRRPPPRGRKGPPPIPRR